MDDDQLLNRIATDAQIMAGKPVVRGTRLTVEMILNLLGHGMTTEQILTEYSHLSAEDISACLLFASRSLAESA
jgi:uncharacterized protein (DUF433 family)